MPPASSALLLSPAQANIAKFRRRRSLRTTSGRDSKCGAALHGRWRRRYRSSRETKRVPHFRAAGSRRPVFVRSRRFALVSGDARIRTIASAGARRQTVRDAAVMATSNRTRVPSEAGVASRLRVRKAHAWIPPLEDESGAAPSMSAQPLLACRGARAPCARAGGQQDLRSERRQYTGLSERNECAVNRAPHGAHELRRTAPAPSVTSRPSGGDNGVAPPQLGHLCLLRSLSATLSPFRRPRQESTGKRWIGERYAVATSTKSPSMRASDASGERRCRDPQSEPVRWFLQVGSADRTTPIGSA
jgi:hypothetical protein